MSTEREMQRRAGFVIEIIVGFVITALIGGILLWICSCSTPPASKRWQADGWTPDREARLVNRTTARMNLKQTFDKP